MEEDKLPTSVNSFFSGMVWLQLTVWHQISDEHNFHELAFPKILQK